MKSGHEEIKNAGTYREKSGSKAILTELIALNKTFLTLGSIKLPLKLLKSILNDSGLEGLWYRERFLDVVGELILEAFDSLGPVYGKAAQISLSRLGPQLHSMAERLRLTRLYGDWPALPFTTIEQILDREIPNWHGELKIDPHPLGVASMAQVHVAVDREGREWVIKVIKPQAIKRMDETISALEEIVSSLEPVVFSNTGRRGIQEILQMAAAMRQETDLDIERRNIERLAQRLQQRKQQVLVLPAVNAKFSTRNVLVVERFHGVSLTDVVAGRKTLPEASRKALARKVLQELLIQVFEIGLFHGDPHAGNLILMDDGTVGLFDWGLAGELLESDRHHVANLLKAVLAFDLERVAQALSEMAIAEGVAVAPETISKELGRLAKKWAKQKEGGEKPALQGMVEDCLKIADRLRIPIPSGLLMMTKSLLTIEGLAKGIDPEVSWARVATPVLFRAARPGMKDVLYMTRRFPKLLGKFMGQKTTPKKRKKK